MKAAAVGAAIGVITIIFSRAIGNTQTDNNDAAYWVGVALGGALIGIVVAAIMNRKRI